MITPKGKKKKVVASELASKIWLHELKATCSTHRQIPDALRYLFFFYLHKKPKATKGQVEYMEKNSIQQACERKPTKEIEQGTKFSVK